MLKASFLNQPSPSMNEMLVNSFNSFSLSLFAHLTLFEALAPLPRLLTSANLNWFLSNLHFFRTRTFDSNCYVDWEKEQGDLTRCRCCTKRSILEGRRHRTWVCCRTRLSRDLSMLSRDTPSPSPSRLCCSLWKRRRSSPLVLIFPVLWCSRGLCADFQLLRLYISVLNQQIFKKGLYLVN